MTATGALTAGILNLSELLPVYFVDRLYLSVVLLATNTAYLVRFRGPLKINCYMWKICYGMPHNLANWVTENCGPCYRLVLHVASHCTMCVQSVVVLIDIKCHIFILLFICCQFCSFALHILYIPMNKCFSTLSKVVFCYD